MYRFQLPTGRVVDISPTDLTQFQKDNPDAVYLGGGENIKQRLVVDGISHTVSADEFDDFLQDYGDRRIETPEQFEIRKQEELDLSTRYAGDGFTLESWEGFVNWWQIDESETQEQNTWVETLFGKNQFSDLFGDGYRSIKKGIAEGKRVDELALLFKVKDRPLTEAEEKTLFEAIQAQSK